MKLKTRHKLCIGLFLVSLPLIAVNYLVLPDIVVTGYSYVNGIETYTYSPKYALLLTIPYCILFSFLWDYFAKMNEKKITAHPTFQSYKIRRLLISLFGFLFSSVGVWGNLMALFLTP